MSDAIIVAIITAGASVLCQIIINKKNKLEQAVHDAAEKQKLNDRLDSIEEKLDIHNGYAEKLGDISIAIGKIETEINNIKERMK